MILCDFIQIEPEVMTLESDFFTNAVLKICCLHLTRLELHNSE